MTAAAARNRQHARPRAILAEGRAVVHRGAVSGRAAVGGGVQGAEGGCRADADRARLLLEGPQAADPRARRRARLPAACDRRSGQGPRHLPEADGDGRRGVRAAVRWQRRPTFARAVSRRYADLVDRRAGRRRDLARRSRPRDAASARSRRPSLACPMPTAAEACAAGRRNATRPNCSPASGRR